MHLLQTLKFLCHPVCLTLKFGLAKIPEITDSKTASKLSAYSYSYFINEIFMRL